MKLLVSTLSVLIVAQTLSPQRTVDELLAQDRAFAQSAAAHTPADAIAAMLANDVVLPVPGPAPAFARGKAAATEALKANPANLAGALHWTPLRGGVSADAQHGFTVGYMTHVIDGKTQHLKYVAYWLKQTDGWRVAAYRRAPADEAPSSTAMLAPAVPQRIVSPASDSATLRAHKQSLEAAEKAFSDEAQIIGLGPAFAKRGSDDAVNVGPRTRGDFVIGARAIGQSVGAGSEGQPSPVTWGADEGSLVATSGDLGVTFGYIRQNAASAGQPSAFPFFTIWRRADASAPWRYIAE
jgi:ketosteroid isomerase-like protein